MSKRETIEEKVDSIKDEIDRLHEIKNKRLRRNAARELVYYLQLHHLDGQS